MANTFDDLVDEYELPQEKSFDALVDSAPEPKEETFFDDLKEYGKTIVKGSIEGLTRFGKMMGPLQDEFKSAPEELFEQTERLDEALPTDEGFVQKGLRRGLREAPSAMAFPGSSLSTAGRALGAGYAGQSVEELGGPEWLQTAAELTAYIGPDITKKLLSTGKHKQIINEARKLGLTDEQITPLLQADNKKSWLAKIAPRRGATEKALAETKSGLTNAYEGIQNLSAAKKPVSRPVAKQTYNELENILFDLSEKNRNKVMGDFENFKSKPMTGDSLINFYGHINETFGPNNKKIQLLKGPIKNALKETNPELAKDFDVVNKLYSKYYNISNKLQPTLSTDIVGASENLALFGSMVTGYYPVMLGILKEKGARKLAQQMLINPRFQQLSNKIGAAIKLNKFPATKKLIEEFTNEIAKYDKDAAKKLNEISDEEILELLSQSGGIE